MASTSSSERARRGPGRRLVKLDRLAQVAEQGVDRKREGVDQRRLAAAGDDDALAGVGPQIRGDLANPALIEPDGRLGRAQRLAEGRLGTSRRRHHLLTQSQLSGQGTVHTRPPGWTASGAGDRPCPP